MILYIIFHHVKELCHASTRHGRVESIGVEPMSLNSIR